MSIRTLIMKGHIKMRNCQTTHQLSEQFLNVPLRNLTYLLYKKRIENYYIEFELPKKSGGVRKISAPQGDLKIIIDKISEELNMIFEEKFMGDRPSKIPHGFIKRRSIITNSIPHVKKKYVINLDIDNFFESIHFGRVKGLFQKNKYLKYSDEVSLVLANLVCLNGKLPQGASTSPVISNMICNGMDRKILKLCKKYRLNYTRYADDLTFSTNDVKIEDTLKFFLEEINKIIEESGFKINKNKTRVQFQWSRQSVTGLVVNRKISVPREFVINTRAMANHLYKNGYYYLDNQIGSINQLEGRFSYINMIDRSNNRYRKGTIVLNSREMQYQKFLFYKNFVVSDCPVIITEGKTDEVYLKAALYSCKDKYPNLWKTTESGVEKLNVKFFQKSKTIKYLFSLSDGGDSLIDFYEYFFSDKPKNNRPNYKNHHEYFNRINNKSNTQIIFLFDNELFIDKKPLQKFVNKINLSDDNKEKLRTEYSVNLHSNIFLLTCPIINDSMKAAEIEDLFDSETLDVEIEGRKFGRRGDEDMTKYYNKNIFSKYIFNKRKEINFENFYPILNNIEQITNNIKP